MVDMAKLRATTNGRIWAEEFMKVIDSGVEVDLDLMTGWFANAIETTKTLVQPPVEL